MNKKFSPLAASQLSVTYRPIGELIPDPRNARTHPKRQIEQLKASIKEFGFTNPILADPEGRIIAGHGRLQAAKALEIAQVPTITLSGLSETQKRALRIADNKIALNASWDLEILQQELGELASIDLDIDPTLPASRPARSTSSLRNPPIPTMRSSLRLRRHRRRSRVTSGFSASTGSDVAMHATPNFCGGSSAKAPRSMPRFSIRRTMSGSRGTPIRQVGIVSSRWPPAK